MVNLKLGGEFDYNDFNKDISNLLEEANFEYGKFKA